MQTLPTLRLKKNEDRRIKAGHLWIYSNEIETPIKSLVAGQEFRVEAQDKSFVGNAYVNPHSLITGRIYSRKPSDRLDTDFFVKRIQTALQMRQRFYPAPYYRLIFGESDGLPGLVVDRFGDTLVAQLNTTGMDQKRDSIVEALRAVIPETTSILFRNDSPSRQTEGLPSEIIAGYGTPPETVLLEENNTQFHAPIWQGQKTGWFYDHRANRSRLSAYVKNQRVLDVFSYLGAWGIHAATVGASEVYCVDASELATQAIQDNAALNNVSVKTLCEDAFDALKQLHQNKEQFDVVILDPPAFVKKLKDKKEGALAYQRINELALKLLKPDGILISCSCSMHMSYDDLLQAVRKASLQTHCEVQLLERGHQAPDHPVHIAIPETDYLKMIIGRKIQR